MTIWYYRGRSAGRFRMMLEDCRQSKEISKTESSIKEDIARQRLRHDQLPRTSWFRRWAVQQVIKIREQQLAKLTGGPHE